MAKIELQITNNDGVTIVADVLDSPFRLNRTVFVPSSEKLKALGGVTSTSIRLAKSKRNNLLFTGKGEFDDYNKFNNGVTYNAVILEDGAELARGTFSFDEGSISWDAYEGVFYDSNIDWVSKLADTKLNELGYVDGKPTWLVPFDGAITFNAVNDLTNNDTDFTCPTVVYNNTPIADYLDLTDEEIWGTFDMTDPSNPKRLTPAFSINDFVCESGTFGTRLGHTFDSFPPAVNYKNLISRVFDEIGIQVDCPLFHEDWFNAIQLPYTGDGYKYNWKNIATIKGFNEQVTHTGESNMDETIEMKEDDDININYASLPPLGGGAGTVLWIDDYKYRFVKENIIKHDNPNATGTLDKIVAYNKFGLDGQYVCPTSGEYTIKVTTDYQSSLVTPINLYSQGVGGNAIWLGASLINNFGSWDANSQAGAYIDRHYAWDDQVLVIRRLNEVGEEVYQNTDEMLYRWMNGENTDFIDKPSDVIAYFSPKRKRIHDTTPLATNQYAGSPITNFESEVNIVSSFHNVTSTGTPHTSDSFCNIEVTLDLKKNERVEMYWTSIQNINGEVTLNSTSPLPYSDSYDATANEIKLNTLVSNDFEITYNCGEYDLDLAKNLPDISCKDFIASFITQFNLYNAYQDGKVILTPQKYFYTDDSYDITSRVLSDSWASSPLPSPKKWEIGYTLDEKDRLLSTTDNGCIDTTSGTNNYGNLEFNNPNPASNDTLTDFNIFSSTKFTGSNVSLHDVTSGTGISLPQTVADPASGVIIHKGILAGAVLELSRFVDLKLPSIQSRESFDQKTLGDLTYDYKYAPRLIYHLGTVNQYTPLDNNYQSLVDSPRADANFILKAKHWFRPTVSQFDHENELFTGISYPSLRYDRSTYDDGLYIKYFENLVQLYNQSEMFSINVALRAIDWYAMTGSRRIRYRDQLYRLSGISDYSPVGNEACTLTMIKEI